MSYTPTTWVTGETITATKLNKLENGVASAGNLERIGFDYDTNFINKSYNYLTEKLNAGIIPYYLYSSTDEGNFDALSFCLCTYSANSSQFFSYFFNADSNGAYVTTFVSSDANENMGQD